ncbi:MAG: hypothetical protein FJX53_15080, partial [Alphaproteobacteria bacterium]|nr:hypothetical protein [Alphaproteobacteria bacterium]
MEGQRDRPDGDRVPHPAGARRAAGPRQEPRPADRCRLWRGGLCRGPHDRQPHQAAAAEIQGSRYGIRTHRNPVRPRIPLQGRLSAAGAPGAGDAVPDRRDRIGRLSGETPHDPRRQRAAAVTPPAAGATGQRRRRPLFPSRSLTRRILAINLLVLAVPLGGFAFLGDYRAGLIEAELEALRVQGRIFAGAVAGGAVFTAPGLGQRIDYRIGGQILLRLVEPTSLRARLFDPEGELIADTRLLGAPRGIVRIEELPSLEAAERSIVARLVATIERVLPGGPELPAYVESRPPTITDYPEAVAALDGLIVSAARRNQGGM